MGRLPALRPAGEENRPDVAVFTNKTEKTKDGKWATTAGCGWKMFARIAGKTITDQTACRLLAGQSVTLKGFTSKSGKKFDAAIRIDKERGTAFDFDR